MTACHPRAAITSDSVARPRRAVLPAYPQPVHAASVEGDVVVDFGIDSAGRVDSAQTRIVTSTHRLFSISVREAIDSSTWVPATRQGQAVPSVRRDTFSFILKDSIAMARDSVATCPKSTEHHRRICAGWVSTRKIERVS